MRCLVLPGRGPFAALALLLLLAAQSAVSADVALDARIGFGQSQTGTSRYRPGSWTPITIYVTGQGGRGTGQLTVTVNQNGHATAYTRKISLHDGPLNEAYSFVFDYRASDYGMMRGNSAPEISAQLVVDGREAGQAPLCPAAGRRRHLLQHPGADQRRQRDELSRQEEAGTDPPRRQPQEAAQPISAAEETGAPATRRSRIAPRPTFCTPILARSPAWRRAMR